MLEINNIGADAMMGAAWARALEGGRVLYFEGPDQHRGWFNSSLMIGVGAERRAPYTDVMTHGWVLDAEGRAMHKSLGNVVSPLTLIERSGADIVRWWALSTDWRSDVRVGDEILQRVSEAYRKVRNTFRFLLGNLHDFTPAMAVARERLLPVDRAFAAHLAWRVERMRHDYERFLFHRVADALLDICTVDLSSVYLDATKDRLYTLRADDPLRRSAQTVLWGALHDLAIAVSPLLVFTGEEVWQGHPALLEEFESVHLATWPDARLDQEAAEDWPLLIEARTAANAAIEPLRASKTLASSLEAEVEIVAPPELVERLARYREDLPGFLLVTKATLSAEPGATGARASARRTALARCERCWTHREGVAAQAGGAMLCARCVAVLQALPSVAG